MTCDSRIACVRIYSIVALLFASAAAPSFAQYDPPPGYYDSATGTGATLRSQLQTIMSTGHVQRTYGDFRYASAIIDRDPNNASNILLVYNRQSVPGAWNCSGSCVWNREHVWPQSLQPGSASNSSTGNLGDPHALRPCDDGINSSRGNKPYGVYSTVGVYGSQGSFYFPGDADKGDIARNLFYSSTRYGLTLVNGTPGSNQMGDLASLLRYHHTDPPDEFERRRNHTIYSSALNPTYYTNNRNAYIDHPEFAWSALGPGNNNSKLYVGSTAPGNGASDTTIDFGTVIVGAASPSAQNVTLHKIGSNPTYYAVTPDSGATSSVEGRYNAFDIDTQSRNIAVGVAGPITSAGLVVGTVTIDNIDVSSGGTGMGSADGDDLITVQLLALDHADASFDDVLDQNTLTIDFGTVTPNSGLRTATFRLHSLDTTPGFTANLDIDAINATGDTGRFATDLTPTGNLPPEWSHTYTVTLDTAATPGAYAAVYTIEVSDEDLIGAQDGVSLELNVVAEVDAAGRLYPFDDNGNGSIDLSDMLTFEGCLSGTIGSGPLVAPCDNHDFDFTGINDGSIDLRDFAAFQAAFGN
ncbi:MAG: endonuclease [Phycisphaerales bacterium]|nr:endonuclease [Phycisphaerales bacterium]